MTKQLIVIISTIVLLASMAYSQEVVIDNFPLGVGGSVSHDFFKPYFSKLKAMVDTLNRYPDALAIVTGGADGRKYNANNDAKNPGLALGRAHALREVLIAEFHLDSARIVIQSKDAKAAGGNYRFASLRIVKLPANAEALEARIDSLEHRPPVETHYTEVQRGGDYIGDRWGLRFGAGLSTSPFGATPIISGALTWRRIVYLEAVGGYTFWNKSYDFNDVSLDTRNRLVGVQLVVYPKSKIPVGVLAGWYRFEQIAQSYYAYVRMSEGTVLGIQITPLDFLSITAAYKPAKLRISGDDLSQSKYSQFLLAVSIQKSFGGKK